jgi:hypothetical protein
MVIVKLPPLRNLEMKRVETEHDRTAQNSPEKKKPATRRPTMLSPPKGK